MSRLKPVPMTIDEYVEQTVNEGGVGYCAACHNQHDDYVDPDGRNIKCSYCGEHAVYGLEELQIMGLVEFTDGE